MGKNSKRLKKKEKRIRAQDFNKQQELERKARILTQLNLNPTIIPPEAALNALMKEEEYKGAKFRLVFPNYNHNECGLHTMPTKTESKSLITLLDRITKTTPQSIGSSGIVRDKINYSRKGQYTKLFDTITKDVELKEAQFAGTGRLYFYEVDSYCCIIAIQYKHKNT